MATRAKTTGSRSDFSVLSKRMRVFMAGASISLFAFMCLVAYLSPFGYMSVTALKDREMITEAGAPILPSKPAVYEFEGKEYPLVHVPTPDGKVHEWALYKKGREESQFIDPDNPEAGPITWEGRWRTLEPVWKLTPMWGNFAEAWNQLNMPRLIRNTLIIAVLGSIGTLLSCTAVAYGFARFRIPGKNVLFTILIATIILPAFVTIVPTYVLFQQIGWVGTFLPLIVPHFFANAYNVFLLRQYFLTIPRELDEAAMIDGANPLRTLISVILPQSIPALVAVGIFHFMWAWNDFFGPLLYLSAKTELQPIAIGIQAYNARFSARPHMVQASAMLGLIVPLAIFFRAKRYI